ncbi:IQ motif, EF-hand binding site [Dillenia turbinata]|uniref:IQ motif, EF-hand binding site n=1 Tax=Dillenia turbinata TaxID=194707 RepID=A0AAN8UV85_9MAGN
MGTSRNWLGSIRNKLFLPSRRNSRTIIIAHSESRPSTNEEAAFINDNGETSCDLTSSSSLHLSRDFSEDIAAIKIQAIFRGCLARRAHRALRSIVKIQAVVRGVQVRRQAKIAFQCMHALVRLQVRVRARQHLGRCPD